MYAFISNECQLVVQTTRELENLLSLFSYPKFKKVNSREEAYQFFRTERRDIFSTGLKKNEKSKDASYIQVQYFIDSNNIYVNVNTKKFGFIKLWRLPRNVKQESTYDYLKLKICNVHLDDNRISHHCLAINNILNILGGDIDIELIVPDISIYLAINKYSGRNYAICRLQDTVRARIGRIYYSLN